MILLAHLSVAQNHNKNLPNYNKQPMHFGFLLGVNQTDYRVETTAAYVGSDSLINPKKFMGFTLGMVMSARISDRFDIRFSPSACFNERLLEFKSVKTNDISEKKIESTVIDLPIMFKFKAQRRRNIGVYMVAGIKPSMALGKKKAASEDLIQAAGFDVALEYGVGLEHYFKMFKLSPEIRVSHGLMNVFLPEENNFSNNISALKNHSISLLFYFE